MSAADEPKAKKKKKAGKKRVSGSRAKKAPMALQLPDSGGEAEGARPAGWLSNLYTSLFVVFVLCITKLYLDQYIEIRRLRQRRGEVAAVLAEVQARHDRIAEEVEYLETLDGVERLARDKLRYIRPDEVILVPLRRE